MKAPALERTSAAKAGWLIILLTLGWVVFFLVPWPLGKPEAKPPAITPPPPSKLRQAGLRDYTDWEGLPEIFTVWADKAEWKDDRTRFAYWHPVAKSYSYYFEATRDKRGFRFKEITEPHELDYTWDESMGEDCPIRFYRSIPVPKISPYVTKPHDSETPDLRVPEDEKRIAPIKPPPLELKFQPKDSEPQR